MKAYKHWFLIIFLLSLLSLIITQTATASESNVTIEFYYTTTCEDCGEVEETNFTLCDNVWCVECWQDKEVLQFFIKNTKWKKGKWNI